MKTFGLILFLLLTSNIYSETVNGYTLPPEPDPKVNNSTLLGIDSNNNGVRDDVERYIINTYKNEQIVVEIGFQVARAYNSVIENPANAEVTFKILAAARYCNNYFSDFANIYGDPILIDHSITTSEKFKSIMLNTEKRIRAYLLYNRQLSGGVFSLPKNMNVPEEQCTFDVERMLMDRNNT